GTSAWANDVVRTGRIKRLLLPNSGLASVMNPLAQAVCREAADIESDIRGITKQAIESDVAVRGFRCGPGNTLTIGNPEDSKDGWVQLETLIPLTGANERPSFRFTQADFPELFAEMVRVFAQFGDPMNS